MLTNVLTWKFNSLYNICKDVMFMKKKNNIKEDIANVKHYLIENFYCNPDNRYTIK